MSKTKHAYEIFRDLLKSEFKIKELRKPKHMLGVRVEFLKIAFRSLNGSLLKKFCVLSLSKKGNKVSARMELHLTHRKFLESEDEKFHPLCTDSKDHVNKENFYVDFACTWSVTGNKHWLKENKRLNSRDLITVKGGSGKPSPVIGIGKLPVVIRNSKKRTL